MLNLKTYGEVVYDAGTGAAVVSNDSGDFTVTINMGFQLFEIHLQRDISKCIVFATAKDPYLNDNPYITVSAQRKDKKNLWVATQNQDAAMFLKPRLIEHFGFWFAVSDEVGRG